MDFTVDNTCLETYPCQHNVVLNDGNEKRMNGYEIRNMYVEKGLTVPSHFKEYTPELKAKMQEEYNRLLAKSQ